MSAFEAGFLQMNVIAPLFGYFCTLCNLKFMNVFSREISVNTQEKSVNTRPSRHKCMVSIVQVSVKCQNESKSKQKHCYEQGKTANWRSRICLFNIYIWLRARFRRYFLRGFLHVVICTQKSCESDSVSVCCTSKHCGWRHLKHRRGCLASLHMVAELGRGAWLRSNW